MARKVTLRGSGKTTLRPHLVEIENRGKTYLLREDEPQEVPNEVAEKLEQLPGHEFDIESLEGGNS